MPRRAPSLGDEGHRTEAGIAAGVGTHQPPRPGSALRGHQASEPRPDVSRETTGLTEGSRSSGFAVLTCHRPSLVERFRRPCPMAAGLRRYMPAWRPCRSRAVVSGETSDSGSRLWSHSASQRKGASPSIAPTRHPGDRRAPGAYAMGGIDAKAERVASLRRTPWRPPLRATSESRPAVAYRDRPLGAAAPSWSGFT